MDATKEDLETGEENLIFKSLGRRGDEGKQWKENTENVLFYFLQGVSEFLNKASRKRVMFQPYGSAAEDLKCVEPNDVGDVDIVIFSNCNKLRIYDEMLEYLPRNPLHVRIKGINHPKLQSCLVQDTGYVATSALKNFHSKIFGRLAPRLTELILIILQQKKPQDIVRSTCHLRNNASSPAVTLNFAQSLNDPQDLPNMYIAQWEWLVHHLCSGSEDVYAREHAETLNVVSQFSNELVMSVNNKGHHSFVSKVLALIDFCNGQNLAARFRDIESRLQMKINSIMRYRLVVAAVQDIYRRTVMPEHFREKENTRREEANDTSEKKQGRDQHKDASE